MRAFITGAYGFLGSHLLSALSKGGDLVVPLLHDGIDTGILMPVVAHEVHGSVLDLPLLERAISQYEIDTVFHLAAQAQVSIAQANPTATFEVNVRGTWNVLEACRRQKVKRIVVASTDKVYGNGPVPYVERQPLEATGIYETSKVTADLLAQSYARSYGMSIAIARCGNFYGPGHLNRSTLIPGTIRNILKGERPVIRSDGRFRRDFLFIEDAVSAYLKLGESTETGAFNFGTGTPSRVVDVVNLISVLMGWAGGTEILCQAGNEIVDQYLDATRACNILGWKPAHTLEEGLTKTIAWYREAFRMQGSAA